MSIQEHLTNIQLYVYALKNAKERERSGVIERKFLK